MAGTGLYWARGEEALQRALRRARHPGVPERPGARLRAGRPPLLLLARARQRPEGRRRRARRSACRWTSGSASAGRSARTPRSIVIGSAPPERPHPREVAAELYGGVAATLDALREGAGGRGPLAAGSPSCARPRTRSAPPSRRSWTTTARRSTRCASTASCTRCSTARTIVIGDGGDFVSYAGQDDRDLRARLLDGPGPVRLPRRRARATRSRRSSRTRTARSACCSATARSASPGSSSTRWSATACRSSA